jgi:hypothetical protein
VVSGAKSALVRAVSNSKICSGGGTCGPTICLLTTMLSNDSPVARTPARSATGLEYVIDARGVVLSWEASAGHRRS